MENFDKFLSHLNALKSLGKFSLIPLLTQTLVADDITIFSIRFRKAFAVLGGFHLMCDLSLGNR